MAEESDPIDRETRVSVDVEETGLQGATNLRFVASIDFLVGRWFHGLAAKADRRARTEQAKTDVQVALIKAAGKIAEEQLVSDPELMRIVLGEQLSRLDDADRKLENKEAVVLEALEALKSDSLESDKQSEGEQPEAVDEDWLNYFGSYAEKATSESMRAIWGRVLAGEVRRPGTFSLTSLRIVSEIRQDVAKVFHQIAQRRFQGYFLAKDSLKKQDLRPLLELENAGLVKGAAGGFQALSFKMEPPATGPRVVQIVVGDQIILVHFPSDLEDIQIPALVLTEAGAEIASLMPFDRAATIEYLVTAIGSKAPMTLHQMIGDTKFSVTPIAVLTASTTGKDS